MWDVGFRLEIILFSAAGVVLACILLPYVLPAAIRGIYGIVITGPLTGTVFPSCAQTLFSC